MDAYGLQEENERYIITIDLESVKEQNPTEFISSLSALVLQLVEKKRVVIDARTFPDRNQGDFTKTRLDALLALTPERDIRILLPEHYVRRWAAFYKEGILVGNLSEGYHLNP
ncbi:MAG: hypothetical protein ABIJ21_00740 [Nanoarchaeota archaeon]